MKRRSKERKIVTLRKREAVTAAILDAAEQVIDAKGLAGATMAEIARVAGVAVGTVYNYVPDRDGLVQALFDDRRAWLVPRLAAAAAARASEPFATAFGGLLRDCLALFDERRRYIRLALELQPPSHRTRKEVSVIAALHAALRSVLARGVRDPSRLPLYTRVSAAALRAVLLDALARDRPFVSDAEALRDVLLRGVVGR